MQGAVDFGGGGMGEPVGQVFDLLYLLDGLLPDLPLLLLLQTVDQALLVGFELLLDGFFAGGVA